MKSAACSRSPVEQDRKENTWKRPIVVDLGAGQSEGVGEGWWEPPRALWGGPSTTSLLRSAFTLSDGAERLCSVFSGLESVEEEDDDEEEEEVVEEDSVQVGS